MKPLNTYSNVALSVLDERFKAIQETNINPELQADLDKLKAEYENRGILLPTDRDIKPHKKTSKNKWWQFWK